MYCEFLIFPIGPMSSDYSDCPYADCLWRTVSFFITLDHLSRFPTSFLAGLITGGGNSRGAGIIPLSSSLLGTQPVLFLPSSFFFPMQFHEVLLALLES